jgi:hypothetical protein
MNEFEIYSREKKVFDGKDLCFFSENQTKGDLALFFCKSITNNSKWKLRVCKIGEKEIEELELMPNKLIHLNGKFNFRIFNQENKKENICEMLMIGIEKDRFENFEKLPKSIKSHLFSFVGFQDLNNLMKTNKTNKQIIKEYDSLIYRKFVIDYYGEEICIQKEKEKTYFEQLQSLFESEKKTKKKFVIMKEILDTEKVFLNVLLVLNKHLNILIKSHPKEKIFSIITEPLSVILIFFCFLLFFYF